ncbi:VOC family protein [Paenibacillus sonchi]
MIKGILETHINVSDYAKSAQFYEKLPGVLPLYEDTARKS